MVAGELPAPATGSEGGAAATQNRLGSEGRAADNKPKASKLALS
jgi:hypothetical protein